MSVIINTNSAATLASYNLSTSSANLQRSLNRLSSGSRIVNPADDAGGLAVSVKLSAAARRMGAAATNIANSQSYLQTQDGSLKVLGKVLDRISELKTLSLDPTKNGSDISNYDAEFKTLQQEVFSIASEKFNGNGLFGTSDLTVHTSEDQLQSVTIDAIDLLGGYSPSGTPRAWSDFNSAATGAYWVSSNAGIGGSPATMFHGDGTLTSTQTNIAGPYHIAFDYTAATEAAAGELTFSGGGSGLLDFSSLVGKGSVQVDVDSAGTATWTATVTADNGATYTYPSGTISNFGASGGGALKFTIANTSGGNDLHLEHFAVTGPAVPVGTPGTGNIWDVANGSVLSSVDMTSISGAIEDVATYRAANGSDQSRLSYASDMLLTNKGNLEQATSRISDVDVAEESATLAKNNVLVQAGTAMLSQANQSSQIALKLIGN